MDSEVKVTINYNCAADGSKRDGLKGYFTKTDITMSYNDISTITDSLEAIKALFDKHTNMQSNKKKVSKDKRFS